jgi:hypothetical protein
MVFKGQIKRDLLKPGAGKLIEAGKELARQIGARVDDRLFGDKDETPQ